MIERFKNVHKATVQLHRGPANFTEQWAVFQSYSYNTHKTTASASGPHSSSNSFQTFCFHLN